jgi:hypothetical protein
MKKILLITLFILTIFIVPLVLADNNLYLYDSLKLQLDINGEFELVSEGAASSVKKVSAELLLYPKKSYRQTLQEIDTLGEVEDNKITFSWQDPEFGKNKFSYSAIIKTENKRVKVKKKISYPIDELPSEIEEYLLPTETIDSHYPQIITQASELAEGETDLFKVAFKLASWVEDNVEYDLSTLTAETSQKASWVLNNRQGVCDEMTSLFIAMARSLGIPARFVSGISYTTSELFTERWQPHGWAEVYFPEVGWVSFDITFGEYGYIDVTHMKLRDGFDPVEPSTRYEWLANQVGIKTNDLKLNTKIIDFGEIQKEELLLEQEILATEVGLGSHNLVKGIVKNTADYYAATTLQLAAPKEVEVIGKNKRKILLAPKEIKETFWIIKVANNLKDNYWYQFPVIVYSEKNVSREDSFKFSNGKPIYSQKDIEKLTVKDEEKSYSRKVSFSCDYPTEIFVDEEALIKCEIKNSGNTNLKQINFCLNNVCQKVDLPINQEGSQEITVKGKNIGWNKIIVSAENEMIEKKTSLEFAVLDSPEIEIKTNFPKEVMFTEQFKIILNLEKKSFSVPENIKIIIDGPGFENQWTLEELNKEEELVLEMKSERLSKDNTFLITTSWDDKNGKRYSKEKKIIINAKSSNFKEKVKMWLNGLLKVFY